MPFAIFVQSQRQAEAIQYGAGAPSYDIVAIVEPVIRTCEGSAGPDC